MPGAWAFDSHTCTQQQHMQMATGDAWSSNVTRGIVDEVCLATGRDNMKPWIVLFFVSYVLVVGLVLINIVIAVLLDEFITTVAR